MDFYPKSTTEYIVRKQSFRRFWIICPGRAPCEKYARNMEYEIRDNSEIG